MSNQVSYSAIILAHFIIPLLAVLASIYLVSYLFPCSGFYLLIPGLMMVPLRNSLKNCLTRMMLPPYQIMLINSIAMILMVTWLYVVLRTLYSPVLSVALSCGLLGLTLVVERFGLLFDQWRKKRKVIKKQ